MSSGPHDRQPVLEAGASPDAARAALVLVHGRGATAAGMLPIADAIGMEHLVVRAPQAAGNTWYPLSFLSPPEHNEPGLSSGLGLLARVIDQLSTQGLPPERVVVLGFSQGACLTAEFLLRNPRRYGGAVLLTGGFQGPAGTEPTVTGSFGGTPILLGSSDPDPHVPWERVEATARLLAAHGAQVDARRYPGMPHTINGEELEAAATIVTSLTSQAV